MFSSQRKTAVMAQMDLGGNKQSPRFGPSRETSSKALEPDFPQEGLDGELMVRRHAFKDAGKRPGLDRVVIGNDLVMLAAELRGDADVRAILPGRPVAERAQGVDQFGPEYVAGSFIGPKLRRARSAIG